VIKDTREKIKLHKLRMRVLQDNIQFHLFVVKFYNWKIRNLRWIEIKKSTS